MPFIIWMDAIRSEMMAVTDRKFWEVTDRGLDFFYTDDEIKRYINVFYTQYLEPYYDAPQKTLKAQPA